MAKLDLKIQRGSTYRRLFHILQPDKTPLDLTGCAIRSKIRKSRHDSTISLNFHAEITDPLTGEFTVSLSAAETETVGFATGVYDVEIVFSNGDVQQVLFGGVLFKSEATYG
jgi:hypothetical protein